MSTTRKWVQQSSSVIVLSTELNSLAAGGLAVSASTINNSQGQANLDGYTRALILAEIAAPTAAFAAGSTLDVWFLKNVYISGTGNQQEDGSSSVTPARPPDISFPMQATANAQNVIFDVDVPPGTLSFLARNNQASGSQALAGGGNKVVLQAYTDQGV